MDNSPGRNPTYPRSQMLRGLLLCTAETIAQNIEDGYYSAHPIAIQATIESGVPDAPEGFAEDVIDRVDENFVDLMEDIE